MVAIGIFTEEALMIFIHGDTSYEKVKKKYSIALCLTELETASLHPAGRFVYQKK
jgi:hypothetical protein